MDGSTAKEASEGEERALTYIVGLETLACLAGMPVRLVFFLAGKPPPIVACLFIAVLTRN